MNGFLAVAVLSLLCSTNAVSQAKKIKWLSGTWKLAGRDIYEIWTSGRNGELDGYSFKVTGADTLVTEKISLKFVRGAYHYIADVTGDQPPVHFILTSIDDNGFVAENTQHDFPKLIRYRYEMTSSGGRLEASIEGDGKVIEYFFYKME